jgi:hypothetical protein
MSEKHTEKTILETVRGFMASRVIISAAEMDLFTLLAQKSSTADEVAEAIGADLRGVAIILDALCAMDLVQKTNGSYRTEPSAVPLLAADTPMSILPMVLHMGSVWRNWSEITEVVMGKSVPSLKKGHPGQGQPRGLHRGHACARFQSRTGCGGGRRPGRGG